MASSGRQVGLAPVPPGQTVDLTNPPTHQGSNAALHTVMLFFVTICVCIRIYTRHFITKQVGLEDCIEYSILLFLYADILL